MGTVGDAYDNAIAESFFASLECELIESRYWKSRTEARHTVFECIEVWYINFYISLMPDRKVFTKFLYRLR